MIVYNCPLLTILGFLMFVSMENVGHLAGRHDTAGREGLVGFFSGRKLDYAQA